MENPFSVNMNRWGFKEFRKWLMGLRMNYDFASIDELLELDEYAKEAENNKCFKSDAFELALINLRCPSPRYYIQGHKDKLFDIEKNLIEAKSPFVSLANQEIAEENRDALRNILNTNTLEYRSLLQEHIKKNKNRAYQLVPILPEHYSGNYGEFTDHPEHFKLVQIESKTPNIRTGAMLELEAYGIYRSNFKRWLEQGDSGKKFLYPLAFSLGLNYALTDLLLHNEGYSYLESVHPADKQAVRAIRCGYSYSMLCKLMEHKGLKF